MPKHAALNKKSASCDNPLRSTNGKGGQRTKSTIMRLNMYNRGKPLRNREGQVIGGSLMMSDKAGGQKIGAVARIAPDRRWFGNTRTISQNDLEKFREEMTVKQADPCSIILRRKKIPMALLQESSQKVSSMNLLEVESFTSTFGGKNTRKRPKVPDSLLDYSALANSAADKINEYNKDVSKDTNVVVESDGGGELKKDDLFAKGQSKRIWGELYKVLDCSDVVLQVVDARNVPGTRCPHIENHLKKHVTHKQLVIILNKCDLVPNWVTRRWVKILSKDFPTIAFHASITNSFGKGALISLLRQFGKLHADKRQISVGVIGYPNTGKSSIINTLMGKKCCKAAPVPGETKIWQYITLMKRIFLIDSPGIVYDTGDDEIDTVLKGVVRAERLETPEDFIPAILSRVRKEYIQRQYLITDWVDTMDFLTKLAHRNGKLIKGGEPDIFNVSVSIINDFQRGKLPYFVAPPRSSEDDEEEESSEIGDIAIDQPETLGDDALENDEEADDKDDDNDDNNDNDNDEDDNDPVDSGEDEDDEAQEEEEEEEEAVVPVPEPVPVSEMPSKRQRKGGKGKGDWNDF